MSDCKYNGCRTSFKKIYRILRSWTNQGEDMEYKIVSTYECSGCGKVIQHDPVVLSELNDPEKLHERIDALKGAFDRPAIFEVPSRIEEEEVEAE